MESSQAATTMTWLPQLVIGMLSWLIIWGSWITLQIMSYKATTLSRDEHAAICDKKDRELNTRLDKQEKVFLEHFDAITKALEKQDQVSTDARHTQNNKLQEIILNMAIMNDRQRKAQDTLVPVAPLAAPRQ